jgi:NDP-sugar pyrophosphorylase family protein
MECVILAGGLGTRMRPLTETIPKAMIPVAGRPFVDHQMHWLAREGVERVVLCIGHRGEDLRDHVGDGRRFGLNVEYVSDGDKLRGTGGALRLALEQGALAERFFVLYGDSYLRLELHEVDEAFNAASCPALMTVLHNRNRWGRSNVSFVNGQVVLYDKAGEGVALEFIDYGLSVLSRQIVEEEIPSNVVFDLATLFHTLSTTARLKGFEVRERFYEVGSPEGLSDLEAYLGMASR